MTPAERRTHWRSIIENQATSGVSIAVYCRAAGIKACLFYAWRRRFKEPGQQQSTHTGGFLQLIPGKLADTASGINVRLGVKLSIEVERGFDPFTLRTVVETLSDLSRCSD
jgi:hypothetical protein